MTPDAALAALSMGSWRLKGLVCPQIEALVAQVENAWREILPDLSIYPLDKVRGCLGSLLLFRPLFLLLFLLLGCVAGPSLPVLRKLYAGACLAMPGLFWSSSKEFWTLWSLGGYVLDSCRMLGWV